MEEEQNMSTTERQVGLAMKTPNQSEHSRSVNDIMTRRLKNRERQRRYRARKRLEADIKNSHFSEQSTMGQAQLQSNGTVNKCMKRIHCKRDWKKDARRAHMFKTLDITPNASVNLTVTTTSESETPDFTSRIDGEVPAEKESHSEKPLALVNCELHKNRLGRRDWKADARNKKN